MRTWCARPERCPERRDARRNGEPWAVIALSRYVLTKRAAAIDAVAGAVDTHKDAIIDHLSKLAYGSLCTYRRMMSVAFCWRIQSKAAVLVANPSHGSGPYGWLLPESTSASQIFQRVPFTAVLRIRTRITSRGMLWPAPPYMFCPIRRLVHCGGIGRFLLYAWVLLVPGHETGGGAQQVCQVAVVDHPEDAALHFLMRLHGLLGSLLGLLVVVLESFHHALETADHPVAGIGGVALQIDAIAVGVCLRKQRCCWRCCHAFLSSSSARL